MPNPIGRKRIPSATSEVESLNKELEALKAMYIQDMANISAAITVRIIPPPGVRRDIHPSQSAPLLRARTSRAG